MNKGAANGYRFPPWDSEIARTAVEQYQDAFSREAHDSSTQSCAAREGVRFFPISLALPRPHGVVPVAFLADRVEVGHAHRMSAQQAARAHELFDQEMLDVDTSAAIIRWMESALLPEGVEPEAWQRWADDGCRGRIEADGVPLTPAMLGRWARIGRDNGKGR